jgi:hypothetical protein
VEILVRLEASFQNGLIIPCHQHIVSYITGTTVVLFRITSGTIHIECPDDGLLSESVSIQKFEEIQEGRLQGLCTDLFVSKGIASITGNSIIKEETLLHCVAKRSPIQVINENREFTYRNLLENRRSYLFPGKPLGATKSQHKTEK